MKRIRQPCSTPGGAENSYYEHGGASHPSSSTDAAVAFSNMSDDDEDHVSARASYCFGSAAEAPTCLARELKRMPAARQEAATKDVLGIPHAALLSPELIGELWEQIDNLEEKPAWDLAVQLDREYTMSPKRAMAFLRSVEGKPKQAAKRLTRHFQVKLDLFGVSNLVKDIELSDFDEYDLEALYSGGFQVLLAKDRAGRPILFGRYTLMKYREVKNMVRVLWYMWNSMVEEEAHQISGVVAIGFENGKLPLERFERDSAHDHDGDDDPSMFDVHAADGGFDRDLAREILKIPLSVPIRPMGYHISSDSTQWQAIFDMVMVTICKFVRVRLRFHYGTTQETTYAMMTHGIPVEAFPITPSGEIDLRNHYAWIEQRRELEHQRRLQKEQQEQQPQHEFAKSA